jgi:acetyl esterase/lipase
MTGYAPGIKEFIDRCNAVMPPDFYTYPIQEQRRLYQSLTVEFPYDLPEGVLWRQHEVNVKGTRLVFRLYEPQESISGGLVIYIRGGGFVVGSLDTHHTVTAEIAAKVQVKVMAVDFRLAPEHSFPDALEDCYNAVIYAYDNAEALGINPHNIIIAGDSSGGNMAVVVAMMCRDKNGPKLAGQALISPVLDFTRWRNGGDDAPLLTGGEMEFYTACYAPSPEIVSHPYVSPLISGQFGGLPQAYIMGAEKDSLLVDSREYARLLDMHGTLVELVVEPGLVHSAVRARALSENVQAAWDRYCLKIGELLAGKKMNTTHERYAIVVDPYSSGSLFAPAFAQEGCKVIAVLSAPEPPEVYAASYRPGDFDVIYVAQSDALEELALRLHDYHPICVLAGCESGVELAEKLAPLVVPDIANVKQLASARRDKGFMAQAAIDAGVPMMNQISSRDFAEVDNWIYRHGLAGKDLVVKPPKSASTDGVKKIPAGRGLAEAFYTLLDKPNRLGIINDRVLVQEYLTGTEYVVDTFSHGGVHTLCNVCQYTKLNNANGMAIYDRMEWVAPDDKVIDVLFAYAIKVLDALGVTFGNAHIEIMLTQRGPRLIEIGARPHGGGHPRLCLIATGDSQVHRSVRFFAQGEIPRASYQLLKHMTVVFFHALQASIVTDVAKFYALKALPSFLDGSILVRDGQKIPATRDLFATLALGFIVLASSDPAQIQRDIDTIRITEGAVFVPAMEKIA